MTEDGTPDLSSKTVKAKGQGSGGKGRYGYSNDRLTRITHNGFNYGFGYNEFGKTRLVAVAGSSSFFL